MCGCILSLLIFLYNNMQPDSLKIYNKIAERVDLFPYLEDLFDSNDTILKYNEKMNAFSMIQADYLMKNRIQNKNVKR